MPENNRQSKHDNRIIGNTFILDIISTFLCFQTCRFIT